MNVNTGQETRRPRPGGLAPSREGGPDDGARDIAPERGVAKEQEAEPCRAEAAAFASTRIPRKTYTENTESTEDTEKRITRKNCLSSPCPLCPRCSQRSLCSYLDSESVDYSFTRANPTSMY